MDGNAATGKYAEELRSTAAKLVAPGKGILAADESTGTIGKRVRTSSFFYCLFFNILPWHETPSQSASNPLQSTPAWCASSTSNQVFQASVLGTFSKVPLWGGITSYGMEVGLQCTRTNDFVLCITSSPASRPRTTRTIGEHCVSCSSQLLI